LTMLCGLMAVLREIDTVMTTIADLHVGTSWKLSTCYIMLQHGIICLNQIGVLVSACTERTYEYWLATKVVLKHKTFSYKYHCCVTLCNTLI
jgi:hypothetical protein